MSLKECEIQAYHLHYYAIDSVFILLRYQNSLITYKRGIKSSKISTGKKESVRRLIKVSLERLLNLEDKPIEE